jgi:polyribonucleotide nucleotidyltransferase
MQIALGQAKDGRLHILGEDGQALAKAAAELGEFAPRIEVMNIPVDKIRDVIGSGGKVIREIVERPAPRSTSTTMAPIKIASASASRSRRPRSGSTRSWPSRKKGVIYEGHGRQGRRLRRLRELLRSQGRPGPHLAAGAERVAKTSDVVKEGDKVWVKLLGFDERGKVDQETGKELEAGE